MTGQKRVGCADAERQELFADGGQRQCPDAAAQLAARDRGRRRGGRWLGDRLGRMLGDGLWRWAQAQAKAMDRGRGAVAISAPEPLARTTACLELLGSARPGTRAASSPSRRLGGSDEGAVRALDAAMAR